MKDGGPAFPIIIEEEHDATTGAPVKSKVFLGMTLRDYFAAKVLPIVIELEYRQSGKVVDMDTAASISYEYSDAMLEEREK